MDISLDPGSSLPPYAQIRACVVEGVRTGVLATGDRLPTVRALADDLGIAANTVAKAFRELEQDGVIATRGRKGTFIAGSAVSDEIETAAAHLAAVAERRGTDPAVALDAARRALGMNALDR